MKTRWFPDGKLSEIENWSDTVAEFWRPFSRLANQKIAGRQREAEREKKGERKREVKTKKKQGEWGRGANTLGMCDDRDEYVPTTPSTTLWTRYNQ